MRQKGLFLSVRSVGLSSLILLITACSGSAPMADPKASAVQESTPKPKPKDPEVKSEIHFECAFSNGEGRVFRSGAGTRSAAEAQARESCQIFSRRCFILDCKQD